MYFYFRGRSSNDLKTEEDRLKTELALKKEKLNQEQQNLDNLLLGLGSSFPFAKSIQDQMINTSRIVKDTNFMFTNAEGSSPEFIVIGLGDNFLINNERRNVNLLVEDWNKLTKISSISNLGLEEAEKIRREAEVIKNFLVNILSIVDGLTPNNSGLSQSEIDTYLAQLPTIDSINQVLAVLDASIASDAQSLEPPAPTVTPDEVIAQQNLVEQTEAEVSEKETEKKSKKKLLRPLQNLIRLLGLALSTQNKESLSSRVRHSLFQAPTHSNFCKFDFKKHKYIMI